VRTHKPNRRTLGQDSGARAHLDVCSWKFGLRLHSTRLWGKRVNLLQDERGLPFVHIFFVIMGVGSGVHGRPLFPPGFLKLIFSY